MSTEWASMEELVAFAKAVQLGSFTKAADALGLQKSAISRSVSMLERRLGAQLLLRSTRSMSLTELGQAVYERTQSILMGVQDLHDVALQQSSAPSGVIKISASPDFGQLRLNHWLVSFLAQYPMVSAEVEYSHRLIDLVHEGVDVAIRVGSLDDSSLVARRLMQLQYGLFAAPHYLQTHEGIDHPRDLQQDGHHLIVFKSSRGPVPWEMEWRSQASPLKAMLGTTKTEAKRLDMSTWLVKPQRDNLRLAVNHTQAALTAAVAGLGVVRLPQIVAQPEVAAGRLRPVLPDWIHQSADVHAVYASNRYLSPKVRAFIDHVLELEQQSSTAL